MSEDLLGFDMPTKTSSIIKVIGVGGGGGNAVNHMCHLGIKDVDFVVCNTDGQALAKSPVEVKIQLGESLTEGRGAGNKPEIGRQAAIENLDDIVEVLSHNTKMVFITAGMGGGTGTGAAPVIAKAAKEMGILTVAIVTIPFRFEGPQRINQAIDGISEIKEYVDSLLVINNEKLREMFGDLKLSQAFAKADDVLATAAKGIAEIITVPGYVNVDFADVQTVMSNSGVAIMGSASAEGKDRAINAIQEALNSPLLNNNDITGAKNILLNITSGEEEVSMDEIGEITDYVNHAVSKDALIIWGTGSDSTAGNIIKVTVIATGFESNSIPELYIRKKQKDKISLEEVKPQAATNYNGDEFVVRQKEASSTDLEGRKSESSRVIEFNVKQNTREEQLLLFNEESLPGKEQKIDSKKAAERIKNIRKNYDYVKEKGYHKVNEQDNIEELEIEPAYIRKKIKIENRKHSEGSDISKYSLEDEEKDKYARLKSNNSFLHDRVD